MPFHEMGPRRASREGSQSAEGTEVKVGSNVVVGSEGGMWSLS